MATCSASELLAAGSCFQCLTKKELQIVIAELLCQIKESGGGGGGTANLSGSGSPVGVVVPDAINQFYTDTAGGFLWQSNGLTNLNWRQLV